MNVRPSPLPARITFSSYLNGFGDGRITPVGEDIKQDIKDVFDYYDTGKKGYLSKQEYKLAFIALFGYKPSKFQRQHLFSKINRQQQPVGSKAEKENYVALSREQFLNAIIDKMKFIDEMERTKEVFNAFDLQSNGFLTMGDLRNAVSYFTEDETNPFLADFKRPPEQLLQSMFEAADSNHDGRVTLGDFVALLKK